VGVVGLVAYIIIGVVVVLGASAGFEAFWGEFRWGVVGYAQELIGAWLLGEGQVIDHTASSGNYDVKKNLKLTYSLGK
jgi:hypothetical protein